jgi:hypothetical protein
VPATAGSLTGSVLPELLVELELELELELLELLPVSQPWVPKPIKATAKNNTIQFRLNRFAFMHSLL